MGNHFFSQKQNEEKDSSWKRMNENISSILPKYSKRYGYFLSSPRICFIFETIFFFIFLILFSYMLLCQFKFHPPISSPSNNTNTTVNFNSSNNTNTTVNFNSSMTPNKNQSYQEKNLPMFLEKFLMFWMICYFIDEIYQVLFEALINLISSNIAHII